MMNEGRITLDDVYCHNATIVAIKEDYPLPEGVRKGTIGDAFYIRPWGAIAKGVVFHEDLGKYAAADLCGVDLRGADFSQVSLRDRFRDIYLSNAIIDETTIFQTEDDRELAEEMTSRPAPDQWWSIFYPHMRQLGWERANKLDRYELKQYSPTAEERKVEMRVALEEAVANGLEAWGELKGWSPARQAANKSVRGRYRADSGLWQQVERELVAETKMSA